MNNQDWLVIHTRSGQESVAAHHLANQQIQTYYPQTRERRPNGGKVKWVDKPLFARYIFARVDEERLYARVSSTRGVNAIVRFGGEYARVGDDVLSEISSREREGFVIMPDAQATDKAFECAIGEVVRIIGGPLSGLTGKYLGRAKRGEKVEVFGGEIVRPWPIIVDLGAIEIATP